jgi:hypothetical protein
MLSKLETGFGNLSIKNRLADRLFLYLRSKSRQFSLDRLCFRVVCQTGRQNRIKLQKTESLTGFKTGQDAQARSRSAEKPVTLPVFCLLFFISLPV